MRGRGSNTDGALGPLSRGRSPSGGARRKVLPDPGREGSGTTDPRPGRCLETPHPLGGDPPGVVAVGDVRSFQDVQGTMAGEVGRDVQVRHIPLAHRERRDHHRLRPGTYLLDAPRRAFPGGLRGPPTAAQPEESPGVGVLRSEGPGREFRSQGIQGNEEAASRAPSADHVDAHGISPTAPRISPTSSLREREVPKMEDRLPTSRAPRRVP